MMVDIEVLSQTTGALRTDALLLVNLCPETDRVTCGFTTPLSSPRLSREAQW
jgi:hypothetical protein